MIQQKIKTTKQKDNYRIAPMRFNVVLFMIASTMLFAGFVSAYVVHRPDAMAKNTWTDFNLPLWFLFSTITAILSSGTIFLALRAAKQDELSLNRLFIGMTLALGILFCVFQYLGWTALVNQGLTLVNSKPEDISASYVWMITLVHVLHVLGGIVLLTVSLIKAFKLEIHKKELTLMKVTNTYWHFVGLLWIYLYLFLYFAR